MTNKYYFAEGYVATKEAMAVEKARKVMAEHLKCQVCGLPWRGGGSTVYRQWLCADCFWWAVSIETRQRV